MNWRDGSVENHSINAAKHIFTTKSKKGVYHKTAGDFEPRPFRPRIFWTGDFGRLSVISDGDFGRFVVKSDGDFGRCVVNSDAAVNSAGDFGRCAMNSDA